MGNMTLVDRVMDLERRMSEVEVKADKKIAVSIRRLSNKKKTQDWKSLTKDQKARRVASTKKYVEKKRAEKLANEQSLNTSGANSPT